MLVQEIVFTASELGELGIGFEIHLLKSGAVVWEMPYGGTGEIPPSESTVICYPNVEADHIIIKLQDIDNPGHVLHIIGDIKTIDIPVKVNPGNWETYEVYPEGKPPSPATAGLIYIGAAVVAVVGLAVILKKRRK